MKKRISLFLSIVMLMGMLLPVNAKEESEGSLAGCSISVAGVSSGVEVVLSTDATKQADEIGCKDIVLQEKVNGVWRDINLSDCHTTNDIHFGGSAVYTSAVKGRSYRAHCTHYAKWGSKTETLYNETSSFVYN